MSNNIYVFEKGKVIANGTHEDLLKNSEVYKNFYRKTNSEKINDVVYRVLS